LNTSKSIAVLPFENLSSDPENEYFSDGITEEIINALSQIEHLKVTARTSSFVFKKVKKDIREIGQILGVSLVLEGSVRKSNNRLRITAQLIRAEDGFHVWSKNFDRDLRDVFELQDEISLLIADKIREHVGHLSIQEHLVEVNTNNVKAYQLYLKGRYEYNKWDMAGFARAAKEYEKSILEDPNFDLPYFGAGSSYSFLGSWGTMNKQVAFRKAEGYFLRGNQLQARSFSSYFSVAKHQFWGLWNYREAHQNVQKAYSANPQDSKVNEFMAEIHTLAGNFPAALSYIDQSLKVDPLSPSHYYTKANIYYLQGQIAQALDVIEKGLAIIPSFTIALELKMACLVQLGLQESFLREITGYDTHLQEVFDWMYRLIQKGDTLDIEGTKDLISSIRSMENPPLLAWDLYLLVHSGHLNEGLQLLQHKVDQKMGQVINLKYDPLLKPLYDHPDYRKLVQQHFREDILSVTVKQQPAKSLLSAEETKYYSDLLTSRMDEEMYYLDVNLGLKDLATFIDLHPNKLSWLLNEKVGVNFYTFVNNYRLEAFKEKAIDPNNQHLSLLGLAYESGFNSKSVFNDFFKKATGLTPKAWVKQHLKA